MSSPDIHSQMAQASLWDRINPFSGIDAFSAFKKIDNKLKQFGIVLASIFAAFATGGVGMAYTFRSLVGRCTVNPDNNAAKKAQEVAQPIITERQPRETRDSAIVEVKQQPRETRESVVKEVEIVTKETSIKKTEEVVKNKLPQGVEVEDAQEEEIAVNQEPVPVIPNQVTLAPTYPGWDKPSDNVIEKADVQPVNAEVVTPAPKKGWMSKLGSIFSVFKRSQPKEISEEDKVEARSAEVRKQLFAQAQALNNSTERKQFIAETVNASEELSDSDRTLLTYDIEEIDIVEKYIERAKDENGKIDPSYIKTVQEYEHISKSDRARIVAALETLVKQEKAANDDVAVI